MKIPSVKASPRETRSGAGTEGRDRHAPAGKILASAPAKPLRSTTLPDAVEAADGQKMESEDKKVREQDKNTERGDKTGAESKDGTGGGGSKDDSPDRRNKLPGTLPEAVDATGGKVPKKEDSSGKSKQAKPKKPGKGQQKAGGKKSPGSTEKVKAGAADSKKGGGDDEKTEEEERGKEEERRKKEEAEKARKLEQQKQEAEAKAKKMKEAETRPLAYWSADNRKPKGRPTWNSHIQ